MITKQHSLVTLVALLHKYGAERANLALKEFKREIPWVLLPDALRAIFGPRPITHFEETPDKSKVSWIKFPKDEMLKELSAENKNCVRYCHAEGYKKSVIGETTHIEIFDQYNWSHPHFKFIRSHLLQDKVLDKIIREQLLICDGMYDDDGAGRFVCRHDNSIVLDGAELRKQIALFEELGFIYLCGEIYESWGIEITREWFDQNVFEPLKQAYPTELAENTYKYMKISNEVNERLKNHEYALTADEISSVYITDNLIGILDKLYSDAVIATKYEIA